MHKTSHEVMHSLENFTMLLGGAGAICGLLHWALKRVHEDAYNEGNMDGYHEGYVKGYHSFRRADARSDKLYLDAFGDEGYVNYRRGLIKMRLEEEDE